MKSYLLKKLYTMSTHGQIETYHMALIVNRIVHGVSFGNNEVRGPSGEDQGTK